MLEWLAEHNCKISESPQDHGRRRAVGAGLDEKARRLLELRQSGAGAAAFKFATLRRWIDEQGEPRIRYAYRYHGGSAGRFTSLGCQLHNLRKPELDDIPGAITAISTGIAERNPPPRLRPSIGDHRARHPRSHQSRARSATIHR